MKPKILNVLLILTSMVGYLEWGKANKAFLVEAEYQVLTHFFTDPLSAIHPFTLLPILGQLLLLLTLFQKRPSKRLTYAGMTGLGLLFAFMLFIGIIALNVKILLSTIPFFVITALVIRHHSQNTTDKTPSH